MSDYDDGADPDAAEFPAWMSVIFVVIMLCCCAGCVFLCIYCVRHPKEACSSFCTYGTVRHTFSDTVSSGCRRLTRLTHDSLRLTHSLTHSRKRTRV